MPRRDYTPADFLPAGTKTQQGDIWYHDVTPWGLGRLAIELDGRYPDIETWLAVLEKREVTAIMYSFGERSTRAGIVGRLWIYYKRPGREAQAH